jgi:hypothetical protein
MEFGTLPLQVFASVILENQVDRNKSVFKRMRIADTNSLAGERFPGCGAGSISGKKVKLVPQQQQLLQQEGGSLYHNYNTMGGGNFFQGGGGGGHVYAQQAALGRRAAPPIRQNMFLIPISR